MSDPALWQSVLGELELSTSKANFETWLRPTKLVSLTNNEAVVSVPTIFVRARIESQYRDQFLAGLKKFHHDITDISFVIERIASQASPAVDASETSEAVTFDSEEVAPPVNTPRITISRTFETFVEGHGNQLACAVSRAVAKSPGALYNPLFIYGGVGLGKTHLMQAIGNEVAKDNAAKKVLYVSSEQFTNDYIASISSKKMDKFKQTYRSVDVLLVDDIQFIANKEGSQEEFFNTFNTLHQSNRQIVIAADRIPKAIHGLEERLSSRFGWGMVVDIQPPNFETRTAILKSKCNERGIRYPEDVLEYIATQVQSNIRDLEGALNRVITYCQMSHIPLTIPNTRAALSGLIVPVSPKNHSIDTLLSLAADHFGLTVADLIGSKRTKELVYPRHITMYIFRDLGMSFPEIGREMGGKDHTTIMHGYNKIAKEMETAPKTQQDITTIKQRITQL